MPLDLSLSAWLGTSYGVRMLVQIIPVIDIRNGIAVRAVAGERSRYRPLESRLTDSTEPAEVLRALQREFRFSRCYVADLDAIEGNRHTDDQSNCAPGISTATANARSVIRGNRCALAEMVRTGAKLIVDAGVRSFDDALEWRDLGVEQVVVSSESLPDVSSLPAFVQSLGAELITFSVDLKHGQLLAADPAWQGRAPVELIETIVAAGVRQIIILDLAAVGTGMGIPTLLLCHETKTRWPNLFVISGGGVDSLECLTGAETSGIDGLLIASALHDGRLPASGGC